MLPNIIILLTMTAESILLYKRPAARITAGLFFNLISIGTKFCFLADLFKGKSFQYNRSFILHFPCSRIYGLRSQSRRNFASLVIRSYDNHFFHLQSEKYDMMQIAES